MAANDSERVAATVVGRPAWEFVLVWIGLPAASGALGWFLEPLAHWALGLEWIPFQGPLELVESLPDPQARFVLAGLGLVGGVVLALTAEGELLRVAVRDDGVRISLDGNVTEFDRDHVGSVFVDGKDLVLLGPGSEEVGRHRSDRDKARLRKAFVAHGYTWYDGDPHRDEYRRWVDGTPDLPDGANAVLRSRERALEKADSADAAALRAELTRMGVVVRDDGTRQHWRRVSGWAHE